MLRKHFTCQKIWHQSVFNTCFSFSFQHNYETSSSRKVRLIKSSYRTNRYGKYSTVASAVDSWSKIQKQLNILLKDLSPNNIKTVVIIFYLILITFVHYGIIYVFFHKNIQSNYFNYQIYIYMYVYMNFYVAFFITMFLWKSYVRNRSYLLIFVHALVKVWYLDLRVTGHSSHEYLF